jgi:hypothetical protein
VWIPPVVDLSSQQSPLRDVASDDTDWAAVEAAAGVPGALVVWRTWRSTRTGPARTVPIRVYLVEFDLPTAELPGCAAEVMTALSALGMRQPHVEVCSVREPAAPHFVRARQGAALLWAAEPRRAFSFARSFDGEHPVTGPYFEQAHPRLQAPEKEAVAGYLENAQLVLSSTDQMDDIVDPDSGQQILLNYFTDGTWSWNATSAYYLRTYDLAPDPELLAAIRANDYQDPR